jgi:hypothetical protein
MLCRCAIALPIRLDPIDHDLHHRLTLQVHRCAVLTNLETQILEREQDPGLNKFVVDDVDFLFVIQFCTIIEREPNGRLDGVGHVPERDEAMHRVVAVLAQIFARRVAGEGIRVVALE